ncbi:unnamed protein product [Vicia faba]|uniref:Exportin-4 n=1 Tax=Vicia faba TaxID=3906 RepID=A0AAV1AZR1_VICFA|nr:unnamed protein product [Vicia faba]
MQGFTANTDFSELQSTMRAIELASASIQMQINPAASEAIVLALGQSSQPYKTCQFILENSLVATARFQAAAAIREAAIREWGFLNADDKKSLISFCLCYAMQHASSPDSYVQAKVSSVAAQLMKRGWLEEVAAEKETLFYQVNQAILGIHGVDVQFAGIKFLESLVSEFSPSTSSAMGLPREFHEQCRRSLERDYLKTFYQWTQEAASSVTNRIIESESVVPEVKVCTAALDLMLQILNWDFRSNTSDTKINLFSAGVRQDGDSLKRSDCHLVQPGSDWRDVLILSGHIGWILSLYAALRPKFSCEGYWLDCAIAVSTRKLIVQLCSLTGTVFPSDDGKMHERHLLQLLSGILEWVDPPDAVSKAIENGKSDSEMIDGCRALLAIANVTTPYVFDNLLKSIRAIGTFTFLSMWMSEVIKVLITSNTEEETWSWEARDILLDTWTALLMPINTTTVNTLLPPEGIKAAANLFGFIVECELRMASASAFNDEGDSDYLRASVSAMDERLSSYALIARASIDVTIPLLTSVFSERVTRLNQGRGVIDLTETLEELYSLLLIIGHVIADEGEGEMPLVPNAIQTQFVANSVEADKHPVILLSSSIIKFAEQCLNPDMRASAFSPRLMESIVWFLARWSSTYLMSSDGIGEKILDSGEKDLQGLTCYMLLHSLVQQRHICVHLVALNSWHELATAFSTEKTLFLLDTSHQRSLAQTLVRSASGVKNSEESSQYVRNLMGHIATYIVEMSSKSNLKNIAQQPDILLLVSCMLERLRGAASASEPRTQKALYELGFSVMNPILVLLEVYKHESAVVYLLLKFVVDWVDGQITYLEAQETAAVVSFCTRLLQLYSSHNIGKISLSLSSNLLSEAQTDKYKDLRALLQLLSSLCSKDMIDFSSDSIEAQGTNISQVVYFGLHIVTPLISMDLLKYPKLCHDYFSLLSHLLEVYPETFAQLNSEAFTHILGTLDFGLHHQDVDVVSKCLRALQALASYHYKETGNGNIGLGAHSSGETQEGLLSRFLRSLLQLLFFEDYSSDLISVAADALFPLILCEKGLYQRLGNELIERQADPNLRSRLVNALQSLTSANQLSFSLDRINYQRFRKNLNSFLVEVRGFLKTV